ncbi:hypothetical protein KDA00_05805, partial [Candidatus Saccharibacteria bacterium]|nr:hypothetical protein [Candidatus Saccharibacteria bacterium]
MKDIFLALILFLSGYGVSHFINKGELDVKDSELIQIKAKMERITQEFREDSLKRIREIKILVFKKDSIYESDMHKALENRRINEDMS